MCTYFRILILGILVFGLMFGFSACDLIDTPTEPEIINEIVGQWLSEDADLASELTDSLSKIIFDFTEDTTYIMTKTDTSGQLFSTVGDFEIGEAGELFSINIRQLVPDTIIYNGIYKVNTNVEPHELTLEIVQIQPDIGATAPSVVDGFGINPINGEVDLSHITRFHKIE